MNEIYILIAVTLGYLMGRVSNAPLKLKKREKKRMEEKKVLPVVNSANLMRTSRRQDNREKVVIK